MRNLIESCAFEYRDHPGVDLGPDHDAQLATGARLWTHVPPFEGK
jgi:hypothetical protein